MTLKDNAGLIKKYAFVSVRDYMLVGVGDTMDAAMKDYRSVMQSQSGSTGIADEMGKTEELSGIVDRIASEINGGNTVYLFTLQSDEAGVIYRCAASISSELALTQSGDEVSLQSVSYTHLSLRRR